MTPLVRFDNVWKKFRRGEVHDSLRDLVPSLVRRMRRPTPATELGRNDFWAVQDVSFRVEPGQVLGIIGANGSGKSTSLKLLTRILEPTRGSCEIRGRAGALIEVAAGFHQDLTGRENVFLQGAIMGMPSQLIRQRFDDIVAFSGIETFIDSPVKRYSSGMNARLGFAIAAHLSPDVLIIDEVLAVGDLAFQQRAFGRIREMARSGIPVVIVSHQLDRVAELCTEVIALRQGSVAARGEAGPVIAAYLQGLFSEGNSAHCPFGHLDTVQAVDGDGVRSGESLRFRVTGEFHPAPGYDHIDPLHFRVRNVQSGQIICTAGSVATPQRVPAEGAFEAELSLQMNVAPGTYVLETFVWDVAHERNLAQGPSIAIRVIEGTPFSGTAQLNPQLVIHSPACP